jgi:hypothetical protein
LRCSQSGDSLKKEKLDKFGNILGMKVEKYRLLLYYSWPPTGTYPENPVIWNFKIIIWQIWDFFFHP